MFMNGLLGIMMLKKVLCFCARLKSENIKEQLIVELYNIIIDLVEIYGNI
jgi:hypothetical protein